MWSTLNFKAHMNRHTFFWLAEKKLLFIFLALRVYSQRDFFQLFLYNFSFNCAVIHETELLCFSVRDDKGFLSISFICVEFKKIKFYSILCEWLEQ